jgi:hypothetical protein
MVEHDDNYYKDLFWPSRSKLEGVTVAWTPRIKQEVDPIAVVEKFVRRYEIRNARKLYTKLVRETGSDSGFARQCVEEILKPPVMARINQETGQDNDPGYWAYLILHFLMKKADDAYSSYR